MSDQEEFRKDLPHYEICACGHEAGSHTRTVRDEETGEILEHRIQAPCKVSNWDCSCQEFRPVIEVSTGFPFRRISRGAGNRHALLQGVQLLLRSGGQMKWLDNGPRCDECGTEGPILPFRFEMEDEIMVDQLLCMECSEGVKDDEAERQSRTSLAI